MQIPHHLEKLPLLKHRGPCRDELFLQRLDGGLGRLVVQALDLRECEQVLRTLLCRLQVLDFLLRVSGLGSQIYRLGVGV